MKFIFQKAFIASLAILTSVAIFFGCRKLDTDSIKKPYVDPAKRFLNVPSGASSAIKRIAETIKKQNDETHFLDQFVKKFGYAIWDKPHLFLPTGNAQGRTNHVPETLAFIPLVADGIDEVHSFLGCEIKEDSVKIRLFRGDMYAAYGKTFELDSLSSETVALECMVLEYKIFGHDSYRVNDLELFWQSPAGTSNASRFFYIKELADSNKQRTANGKTSDYYVPMWTTYCVSYIVDEYEGGGQPLPPPNQPAAHSYGGTNCYDVLTWFQVIEGTIGPGGGSGTIPTGGGGGNPWYEEDPCRTVLPGECGDDVTEGWVYVGDADPNSPYMVAWVDTIGIASIIRDSFPCLFAFLNDSLPNINYLSQLAGAAVFKDSTYMNLTFDTSTTFTTQGQSAAETDETSLLTVDSWGITHWHATIKFNGWYLRHATKEYMITTIVHEAMHAVFQMRWKQYLKWLQFGPPNAIDSNWIKAHYPLQWSAITGQLAPLTDIEQHEIMATDYFNMFNSIVGNFWNPAASQALKDSTIKAICWGGLLNTDAWKNLPNHGIDTCYYRAIQTAAENAATGQLYPPGCGSGYNYNYNTDCNLRLPCN